jgi:hypothetical protein
VGICVALAHDLVQPWMIACSIRKLYSHRDNDQSHEMRDSGPTTAASTDVGDEKDQADGSLLSGFRSGQPIRIGSKGADFSRSTGDWLKSRRTENRAKNHAPRDSCVAFRTFVGV